MSDKDKSNDVHERQYREMKERHPGMLMLFKAGDFYEALGEDAEKVAIILGLTLTRRDGFPMTGFPNHALEANLHSLLHAGHRVAVCEKVEGMATSVKTLRVVTTGGWEDDHAQQTETE